MCGWFCLIWCVACSYCYSPILPISYIWRCKYSVYVHYTFCFNFFKDNAYKWRWRKTNLMKENTLKRRFHSENKHIYSYSYLSERFGLGRLFVRREFESRKLPPVVSFSNRHYLYWLVLVSSSYRFESGSIIIYKASVTIELEWVCID